MAEPFGGLQTSDRGARPSPLQGTWDRIGFHGDNLLQQAQPNNGVLDRVRQQNQGGFPVEPQPFFPRRDIATVTDVPPNIQNGVLTVRIGDRNIDRDLASPNYNTIKIDTPQTMSVQNWADANGYYMWFRREDNGQSVDGQKHYYPPNAKQLSVNGQTYDLEAQRLKVNEDIAAAANGGQRVFQNLDKRMTRDPLQVVQYAAGIANLGSGVLNAEESALTQSVRTSNNPYFKIYLADVYVAQAMQPIIDQVKTTGHMDVGNPETVRRLDMAINLLNQAVVDSRGGLSRINANPGGNVTMPMNPYDIYMSQGYTPYYGFWAGSYDQASCRAATLTTLRNMITTGSVASMLRNVEVLPPRMAPR